MPRPLVLLVISAVVGGFMMFIYSGLLILTNRRILPEPIRIRGGRLVALVWAILLFGTLSVLTFIDQGRKLLGADRSQPISGSPGPNAMAISSSVRPWLLMAGEQAARCVPIPPYAFVTGPVRPVSPATTSRIVVAP